MAIEDMARLDYIGRWKMGGRLLYIISSFFYVRNGVGRIGTYTYLLILKANSENCFIGEGVEDREKLDFSVKIYFRTIKCIG